MKTNKLWGSAFSLTPSADVLAFCSGRDMVGLLPADYQLVPYDIWGSTAHVLMLNEKRIIDKQSAEKIIRELDKARQLFDKGLFKLDPVLEDVHTNIESYLTENLGMGFAGKLHTARSRNDQVVLDMRLWMRDQAVNYGLMILLLAKTLLSESNKYGDYIMPGFTHHQHAMITTFGHLLQAYACMVIRDANKFLNWLKLYNINPLGSAAAYGTTFAIDRSMTSELMGFDGPETNSMDLLTNRGEPELDLAFAVAGFMNHMSSLAQTLVVFSTPEFGFIKLSEMYSTGSSIMPHKKNPDPLEAIKAKASFAQGIVTTLLSLNKASFIGYNKDSQWSKYQIFDLMKEVDRVPEIVSGAIKTAYIDKEKMQYWANKSMIGATTLMELLAGKYNLPLRQAKIAVEKSIKYSNSKDKIDFIALKKALDEEKIRIDLSEKTVNDWQEPKIILSLTNSFGSPGSKPMKLSFKIIEKEINSLETAICTISDKISESKKLLELKADRLRRA